MFGPGQLDGSPGEGNAISVEISWNSVVRLRLDGLERPSLPDGPRPPQSGSPATRDAFSANRSSLGQGGKPPGRQIQRQVKESVDSGDDDTRSRSKQV